TYTWGIAVTLPLFDGFKRDGRQAEQEAQLREYEARERDLRQQVTVEVRSALLDVVSTREQADAAEVRLKLAEQELAEARDRFKAGVAGNADVVTASLSLNAARTQLVDALVQSASARVQLARVQGLVAKLP
ncbi:MAG: TolC family protein, partial [Gemmatimonadetes bacterium]|nr:TolC family protein [Gemmatimonadota bacterium]